MDLPKKNMTWLSWRTKTSRKMAPMEMMLAMRSEPLRLELARDETREKSRVCVRGGGEHTHPILSPSQPVRRAPMRPPMEDPPLKPDCQAAETTYWSSMNEPRSSRKLGMEMTAPATWGARASERA